MPIDAHPVAFHRDPVVAVEPVDPARGTAGAGNLHPLAVRPGFGRRVILGDLEAGVPAGLGGLSRGRGDEDEGCNPSEKGDQKSPRSPYTFLPGRLRHAAEGTQPAGERPRLR